jgi:hypothetical protein
MGRIVSYDFRFGRMILQNKLITKFFGRRMEMFLHLRSPSYSRGPIEVFLGAH